MFDELAARAARSGRPVVVREHVLLPDEWGKLSAVAVGTISDADLQAVFAKITRGLYFKKYREILPPHFPIKATAVTADEAAHITRVLDRDYSAPVNHVGETLAWTAAVDVGGREHGFWFYVPFHATMVVVGTGRCADAKFSAARGLLLRAPSKIA